MRRAAFLAFLLLLPSAAGSAQERPVLPQAPGIIHGVVASAEGQPLESAAITVRSAADSAVVTGVLTNAAGRFRIEGLPLGRYLVHVSFIGYTSADLETVELTAANPVRDLGTTGLELAPVSLEGVEAAAERSPVILEADRTIYDTKAMPAAEGGSAADVLRQIDELEVDFNGKVSLAGNRPVAIHINGRPAPMKGEQLDRFLSQLSGKMVSKVEVMPNPSAKHDPEGMGGIVNIVLRENVDLGLSGNFGLHSDSRGNRGLSGRLAWQKGRFTFFGGGSGSIGDDRSRSYDLRQNLISTPVTFFEQTGRSNHESGYAFGDFSAEFKLAEKTILWGNGYGSTNRFDTFGSTLYGIYDENDVYIDRYTRITTNESDHLFYDVGLGLKHQFVPQRHELTMDVRRNANGGQSLVEALKEPEIEGEPRELTENDTDDDYAATTVRADYVRPWGQGGNLSAGISIAHRTTDQDALQQIYGDVSDPDPHTYTPTAFTHDEWIRSVYLTAARRIGRFNLQAGLRGEFAATEFALGTTGEVFENDYNSVFPNFSVAYELSQGKTLRVGYSKRVGRPPVFYLNPFRPTTDPLNRFEGNPHLGPNYTHSFNADLSWIGTKGTLRIAPYMNRTVDSWESIKHVDENGVAVTTYENSAEMRRIGTNFTIGLRPQGRIGGSIGFSVFHVRNDATNISQEFERESLRWSTSTYLTGRITNALSATMNAHYQPPRDLPQGRQSGFVFSSIGLRQQLFAGKATVNLYVNDPLDIARYRMETRDATHIQLSRTTRPMRSASFSLSYNFGKPPQQHSRRDEAADPGTIRQ